MEQQIAKEFVHSSHTQIPTNYTDLKNMNIPFVLAVSPFKESDSSFKPPILPYDLSAVKLCSNCHSFLNTLYTKLDDSKLVCPVCHEKNKIPDNYDFLMRNSSATKSSVFDIYFPENNQDSTNEQKEVIDPPSTVCQMYLLVIERSESTVKSGLFQNTIEKVRETFLTKTTGVISVFVFDSYLHVPFIPKNNFTNTFSQVSICDVGDDTVLPPPTSLFFDIEKEKDLFNQYLDLLISSIPDFNFNTNLPLVKLYDLIRVLNLFCRNMKIPSVIVASQNPIGTSEEFHRLGLEIMRKTAPFKFFCVAPSTANPPNFSPLSDFSFIVNSKCQVYSQSQIGYLPIDIVNELQQTVYFDIIVYMTVPDYFKIVDIKGPGIRRSDKSFILPYMSPDDSVYVYLDYKVSKLMPITHSIQAQVRFLDPRRKRYVRDISLLFYAVNNNQFVANNINYDVYLASIFTNCIDKAKEFGNPASAIEEFRKIRKEYNENNFSRLYLSTQPGIIVPKINCAFSVAESFLSDPINYPLIFGRSPIDVSRFFVPIGYSILSIDSDVFQGPMTLGKLQISFGALYVKMNNRRGLFIINDQYVRERGQEELNDFISKWTEAVNFDPLRRVLGTISQNEEKIIETIVPSLELDHNLYRHVLTCIGAKI